MSGYTGYQQPDDGATEFSAHAFVINSIIGKLATVAAVQVMAVTNAGGVSPVGFVDVQPMVNQVDGAGNPTPHATIHNLPYFPLGLPPPRSTRAATIAIWPFVIDRGHCPAVMTAFHTAWHHVRIYGHPCSAIARSHIRTLQGHFWTVMSSYGEEPGHR